jgi:hypothetical protein
MAGTGDANDILTQIFEKPHHCIDTAIECPQSKATSRGESSLSQEITAVEDEISAYLADVVLVGYSNMFQN